MHWIECASSRADRIWALERFDPWIFLYSEDADLCFRTWLVGKRVLKAWNAIADHDLGGAGGGIAWSGEQVKNGLYVYLKTRAWPAVARYAVRMAIKTAVRSLRLRDPALLSAWTTNLRELGPTLRKRQAVRDSASAFDRRRLEKLGAQHAYWARRAQRKRMLDAAWRRAPKFT